MTYDFDVKAFCNNLRATKPPYQCPIETCGKTYKSWSGIQFHMYHFDHDNPDSGSSTPVAGKKGAGGRKKGKQHHRSNKRSPSPSDVNTYSHRETLTYAEAQRLVEVDIHGKLKRINIYEPIKVVRKCVEDSSVKEELKEEKGETDKPSPSAKKKPPNLNLAKRQSPLKLPEAHFKVLDSYVKPTKKHVQTAGYFRYIEKSIDELDDEVEYDMDDQDAAWLKLMNGVRKREGASQVSIDTFEFIMDRFEKEAHFQSQNSGELADPPIDEDAVCSICMDGECQNSNVILFCDMCNLAVHQECYGVPYIPEGQWLCRRCLQSPSRAVDCCLCPNKGGAFKQTEDGRWAHVICAIWIPEVVFANTVFLEPVDGLRNIPPARWKLSCYICKQKSVGACIQCHKTNCYTAFHVTCAQQAGLYMKVESVKSAIPTSPSGMAIRKTAFCDLHTPSNMKGTSMVANSDSENNEKTAQEKSRIKMRKARKILAEKRNAVPVVSIPIIPEKRLQAITTKVRVGKKESLLKRLMAYWTLKRQSRNGVPLLRRLQSHHMSRSHDQPKVVVSSEEAAVANAQLKYWKRLRQDLEKARLLVELIRKREKLKREELRLHAAIVEMKLSPLARFLQKIVEDLKEVDTAGVFAQPVDIKEVPDYLDYISSPIDLSTIQDKVVKGEYSNLDSFQKDVDLMIKNCMVYNTKETPFYKVALKMRDQGGAILRGAQRMYDYIGFDDNSGLLLPDRPEGLVNPHDKSRLVSSENITKYIEDLSKQNLEPESHLKQLIEQLDLAILHKGRKWKVAKLLRKEVLRIQRLVAINVNGTASEVPSALDESSVEEDAPTPTPDVSSRVKQNIIKPDRLELEGGGSKKADEVSVSSNSTEASLPNKPHVPSPGTLHRTIRGTIQLAPPASATQFQTRRKCIVNRRTAVLFASKKLARRQPTLVTSPLASTSAASNKPSDSKQADLAPPSKKSAGNKTPSHKGKPSQTDAEKSKLAAGPSTSGQGKKRAADGSHHDEPDSKKSAAGKAPAMQRQESFTKYRGSNFSTGLLSASELEELSTTDTDASESETEESSAADPLAGSISAGSSSAGRRLRSAEDKYSVPLTALDLVWAKCRGYPWYPAMIVDPKIPKGYTFNGVPIPKPPEHVLNLQKKFTNPVNLILFFDAKRTWQWLPRDKLEPLGVDSEYDQQKLSENRKPNIKKAVMNAYEKAIRHQRKIDDGDDEDDDEGNK